MDIHVGSCIREAHKQTGRLHKDVASIIECDRANYSHLLSQGSMRVQTFYKVCNALGMTMDEVIQIKDLNNE